MRDGTSLRHAVVYRHEPAGGGAAQVGVWIAERHAPDKGSRERPAGDLVAIWASGVPRLGWQGGKMRLVTEPDGAVARPAASLAGCLGGSRDGGRARLCYDPARVTLVPLPR